MLIDFHTHYPMHLSAGEGQPGGAYAPMTSRRARARYRARVLRIAAQLANYDGPGGGPGVTMDLLRRGDVGVALSVIYSPFAEMDLAKPYDHVAIGSDLDGFIKPMLRGLEHSGRMSALQDALRAEYGEEIAEKICSGNVLRLLRRHWGARARLTSAAETPAMAAHAA